MSLLCRMVWLWALGLWVLPPAHAHQPGETTIFLTATDDTLVGRFEVRFSDLDKALPLDADGDANISLEEFTAKQGEIAALLEASTVFHVGGRELRPQTTGLSHRSEVYAMVDFTIPGLEGSPETIELSCRFPWDGPGPNHTALVVIENNARTGIQDARRNIAGRIVQGDERRTIDLSLPSRSQVLLDFVEHGVWHIWIGFDHILFILALLLPAVLVRKDGAWVPVAGAKEAFRALLRVVSMFTLAHSATLTLAALGMVALPERIIESIIALSIGVMALNNIRPVFNDRTWLMIFAFGLFHGLGFASVMEELHLKPAVMLTSMVGFNVGVEIGQVAIVSVVFPLLFVCRRQTWYVPVVLVGGSVVLTVFSAIWFTERLLVPVVYSSLGTSSP